MKKSGSTGGNDAAYMARILKKLLTRKTFAHTVGVSKTAVILAARFGAGRKKAAIAGLLHDCAKDIRKEDLPAAIKKYGVKISRHDRKIPEIWHGLLGAKVAEKEFGIKDPEILNAVRMHSTGGARMGRLEKIIYAADFIEPGRKYESSRRLRKLLKGHISLDYLVLRVLKEKVRYLGDNEMPVHHSTKLFFNQITKMHSGNG